MLIRMAGRWTMFEHPSLGRQLWKGNQANTCTLSSHSSLDNESKPDWAGLLKLWSTLRGLQRR